MKIPSLVRDGLSAEFEVGYNSKAHDMLYKQVKKSPEEISEMIRETWSYIKEGNKGDHIVSHFMYLLSSEVEREWIKDISLDIVKYGLDYNDSEVIDNTIGLVESWCDKDLLDLLYNTEIKTDWLNEYKNDVLREFV